MLKNFYRYCSGKENKKGLSEEALKIFLIFRNGSVGKSDAKLAHHHAHHHSHHHTEVLKLCHFLS